MSTFAPTSMGGGIGTQPFGTQDPSQQFGQPQQQFGQSQQSQIPQHLQQQLQQLGQQQPFQSLLQQFGQQPGQQVQGQVQPQMPFFVAYATAVQAPIAPFPGIQATMTLLVNGRPVRLEHPSQFIIESVLAAFRYGQHVRVAYDDRMQVKGIEIEASKPM
ncbi:hypothetical protein ACT1U9_16720 [Streptomyces sp. BR1]|uniref:hypothetical protein n=1 Tax=Streptomyces sp. BR1 TaxID=1592323 RepID=UPI00402B1C67